MSNLPPPASAQEWDARCRLAMRQAIEAPQRDEDPRIAVVLQLAAAAYSTPRLPGDAPVDPVSVVRWFVGMYRNRGIDLDMLARAAEHDVLADMVAHAYADRSGSC